METTLNQQVIDCLHTIFDPEIPVNIYDLGLIYEVNIKDGNKVGIVMTLTAPNCPAAQSLPLEINEKVSAIPGVEDVHVNVTWTPKWEKSMMSEVAQLELGWL